MPVPVPGGRFLSLPVTGAMNEGEIFAVLAALVWSSCVILMRVAGFQIPPVALTVFKSGTATIFFVIAIPLVGESFFPSLSACNYLRLTVSAILGITIADTLYAAALNRLGASLQALAGVLTLHGGGGVSALRGNAGTVGVARRHPGGGRGSRWNA